jgi:hypothetical protein
LPLTAIIVGVIIAIAEAILVTQLL